MAKPPRLQGKRERRGKYLRESTELSTKISGKLGTGTCNEIGIYYAGRRRRVPLPTTLIRLSRVRIVEIGFCRFT